MPVLEPLPVLLTRETEDNGPLRSILEEAGVPVLEWPGVSTEFYPASAGPAELRAAFQRADWVVFTTRRAVVGAQRALSTPSTNDPPEDALARALSGCQVAAVGPATEDALSDRGIPVALVGDGQGITTFGPQLIESLGQARAILLIRSRVANQSLPDLLRVGGLVVDDRSFHGPGSPPDRRESQRALAAAVYASPTAARRLLEWNPWLRAVPSVAIGPTTAKTLRTELGLAHVHVSESSSAAALFDALRSLLDTEGTATPRLRLKKDT